MKMLLLATAAALTLVGSAHAATPPQSQVTEVLFANLPGAKPWPGGCRLKVNTQPVLCDLVLFYQSGNRTRVQVNNDDSGRMVTFDGKITVEDPNTSILEGVTLGVVKGQPTKVQGIKGTGICHGQLFEILIDGNNPPLSLTQ
jgi:hypothetical protein